MDIAAVVKPTERAGACSWLKVRSRRPVRRGTSAARSASVEPVTMVEVTAIEVAVVEVVAIDDRSAVRNVGIVVVNHPMAVPIASPVMPAPTIPSEETDSETDPCSGKEDPRHGIPAWIRDDRLTVDEPRIVRGHIDNVRIGWFNDDRVALSCYLFLFIAVQVAGLVSLLTHHLDGIRDILLLVGVCVAKG